MPGPNIIVSNAAITDLILEHTEFGMFNVTVANRIVAKAAVAKAWKRPRWIDPMGFDLNAEIVAYLERCVDPLRLARIRPEDLARPGIGVVMPTGKMLLLDGHHRALLRQR